MKRLLIDIGNSRIKGCIAFENNLEKIQSAPYEKGNLPTVYLHFFNRFKLKVYQSLLTENLVTGFDSVYISYMDKNPSVLLINHSKGYTPIFVNTEMPLPIKINYAHTLGSDRICSAVGAYTKFKDKKNILIIDFGTATTLNIVSNGIYKGGMISPGLVTSAIALMNRTTLPKVFLASKVQIINTDTESAIASGIVLQHSLFIKKAIEEYKKLFKDLFVVATGGCAEYIKNQKTGIDKFEPNLVLEGLNHIAIYNETIRKK